MRSPSRIASVALLVLVVSACMTREEGSPPGSSATPAASPSNVSASPSLSPSPSPPPAPIRSAGLARRCGPPDVPSRLLRIRSTDGVTLAAASIGTGPRGVVLLHQSDGDSCGWWSFGGPWLAARGYRVLMVDLRCFGESTCPSEPPKIGERLADVQASAAWLRKAGVRSVAVVGVSMGGTIAAAAAADDRIAAAVDVSGELTTTTVRSAPPLSARTAVPRLRAPLLYLTAEQDQGVDHAGDVAALAGAPRGTVTTTVVPGSGDHGWSLLTTDGGSPSRWALQLEAFLRGAMD